ncbi:MAG: STAS domain-containing protein [Burkholderiaceae bacterium]
MGEFAAPQRLTLAEANAFLDRARESLRAGERTIDLSACRTVDSSALAVLLELNRQAAPQRLTFSNPSDNLRKLADLYGVTDLLF